MNEHDWLAERFEENRPHLRAVAYRMLGSASEADDAVQETWLRLSRAGTGGVENLGGWLTTIVARVSLNMLRSRTLRREEPMDAPVTGQPVAPPANGTDPEHEAVLADSVGLALLVVLDTLTPAERLAFVLHDMFAVPFEEIAPIVERSPVATRQLASRARRRVQEAGRRRRGSRARSRGGGRWSPPSWPPRGKATSTRCSRCSTRTSCCGPTPPPRRWARTPSARSRAARAWRASSPGGPRRCGPRSSTALPGAVWTLRGETRVVFAFTITGGTITAIEQIADPERIARLEVIPLRAGLRTRRAQRGQLAGSSGIALARTTLA